MSDSNEFHLPHGSVWPFWIAMGISGVAIGIVTNLAFLAIGLVILIASLVGWFREDTRWYDEKVGTGPGPAKLGAILFMSSEVFLFGALFATYFSLKGATEHWPDIHVELPLLKTGIFSVLLISSSFTLTKAEKLLLKGNHKGFRNWLALTIGLGAVFLAGQVWEYTTLIGEGMALGSSKFSAMFYMITGTHGLHVFGGLVMLVVVWLRARKGQFSADRHVLPQTAGWYWHFVDAIWILVFGVLYLGTQL